MSISLARKKTPLNSGCLVLLCGAMFLVSVNVAAAQQEPKTSKAQEAPAALQAEKKPNVVVFALSGTPTPGKQLERPKDVPRFRPLSNAEKLNIAQGVKGLPNLTTATVTPFLTLTIDHMEDPSGSLTLNWPDRVFFPLAHYGKSLGLPNSSTDDSKQFNIALVNQEYVEVDFQVEVNTVYMVDFFISVDVVPTDFQLTLGGVPSPPQRANIGGNHLFSQPVYVSPVPIHFPPGPRWLNATLRLAPRPDTPPYPVWGPWYFIAAEVTKFVPAP